LKVGARTLGTEQIMPGKILEGMPPEAYVWWERPYMMEAEEIYFWRTGYERPGLPGAPAGLQNGRTPITWLELMEIYNDPALRAKTTEIWLPESETFKP
jgi:hypothetical protein